MKPIILISANSEWRTVKKILSPSAFYEYPYGRYFEHRVEANPVSFFHSGWGKVSSAAALQYIIDHHAPDFLLNLGTCGGFDPSLTPGEIILVERTWIYDIVELMGDTGAAQAYFDLSLSFPAQTPFPVRRGAIASADSDLLPAKIPDLAAKGAIAADWESGALAWVAARNGIPLLILRGVSDLVTPEGGEAYGNVDLVRDRTAIIMQTLLEQLPAWLDWLASRPR